MMKEKVQIVTGTVVLFLAVVIFAVYQGGKGVEEVERLKTQDRETQGRLATLKRDLEGADDFSKKYEALKEELEKYLFKDQDIPAFLDGMSNIARMQALDINSMRTRSFSRVREQARQDAAAAAAAAAAASQRRGRRAAVAVQEEESNDTLVLASLPINMTASGPFENFLQFLKGVEQFEQLLTVSDINISRGAYPQLKYSFTIDIYSLTSIGALSK